MGKPCRTMPMTAFGYVCLAFVGWSNVGTAKAERRLRPTSYSPPLALAHPLSASNARSVIVASTRGSSRHRPALTMNALNGNNDEGSKNGGRGKIAVIGATGKVGRLAVQELLQQGYTARVLWRHSKAEAVAADASDGLVNDAASSEPPTAESDADDVAAWYASEPLGVEKVQGDVTQRESLDTLLCGCTAVLALHGARRTSKLSDLWRNPTRDPKHSKNVNYEGVRNLIAAARASESCKRIVRLTGKGETPWSIFSILINGLGSMAKAWNYEGENLLRACDDLEYTIVRPGVMRGTEGDFPKSSLALADDGGDLKVTSIPHGLIARLCVESLGYPNAGRSTLCAMATAEPGTGSDDWKPLLQQVQADRRKFREDLLPEHFKAVQIGGAGIVAVACGILFGVLAGLKGVVAALLGLVLRGS